MAGLLSRLDDHVLGDCVRRLPVHPRPFAITARAGKRLQRAVEAAREELGEQVCEEHGLESVRSEAAGRKLIELVRDGDTAGSLRLVVAGAPLDLQDRHGFSALLWAARYDHVEIAVALIEAGAALDTQTPPVHDYYPGTGGCTALMMAAHCAHTETATVLIGAGAALDLQDEGGHTALMVAACNGSLNSRSTGAGEALVQFGLELDQQQCRCYAEIATALINAGAALDIQTIDAGNTALMLATLAADYDAHTDCWRFTDDNTDCTTGLIEAGAALDLQDHNGFTALSMAVELDWGELTTTLIRAGAPLDLMYVYQTVHQTALMMAADLGNTNAATALIEGGAALDLRSDMGKTALMITAGAMGAGGSTETAGVLIRAGAALDLQDPSGCTALMWAAEYGYTAIVAGLTEAGAAEPDPRVAVEAIKAGVDALNELFGNGDDGSEY